MTKVIAVCAALYFAASPAAGQLVVTPFDPQREHASISYPELMAAADEKILMRLRGFSDGDPPSFWSSLYVLDSTGKVLRRIDLPNSESTIIVPYRQGFIARHYFENQQCDPPCGRYIPGRSELLYYDLSREELQPVVVDRREGSVDVVGGPDRLDLYLIDVESEEAQVSRITRLDDEFQPVWSRSYELLDWGSVTATDDGIVLEQQHYVPAIKFVLRAIGRNGVERWNSVLPERVGGGIKFVPTGFLVLPATRHLSPYRVDANTGWMLPDVELPPTDLTAPTEDGLLLVGPMLGQSYAAMLKADGTFAWMRRFNRASNLQTFKDGLMTSNGRLLLIAEGDFSSKLTFLSVDRKGEALTRERSGCLTVPPQEALALNERLRAQTIYVAAPNEPPPDRPFDPPVLLRDGCPVVTEPQYMAFMDALLSELPLAAGRQMGFAQVAVRLMPSEEPSRLLTYGLAYGGPMSRGAYAEFLLPHDQGAEFGSFFATDWKVHVTRMMALQDEFEKLTRFRYGARMTNVSNYRQALADLEAAAVTLNERIKAMPADKIAYVLETHPTDCVGATLTPDGFGTGYDGDPFGKRPLSDAVETLLQIAQLRRKSIAEGNICTSG